MLTRKQQWRRCRHKRRAESCDMSLYDDLLQALNSQPNRELHRAASAPELLPPSELNSGLLRPWHTSDDLQSHAAQLPVAQAKPLKQVKFSNVVRVVLIPTRKEYAACNLTDELWWNDANYAEFKKYALEKYLRRRQRRHERRQRRREKEIERQQEQGETDNEDDDDMFSDVFDEGASEIDDNSRSDSALQHTDSLELRLQDPQIYAQATKQDCVQHLQSLASDIASPQSPSRKAATTASAHRTNHKLIERFIENHLSNVRMQPSSKGVRYMDSLDFRTHNSCTRAVLI